MKKIISLFLFVIIICKISLGQTPDWQWARSAGGDYADVAYSVAVDASGNSIVAGYSSSPSIIFGSSILYNTSGSADIFVIKYSSNGTIIWAKNASGTGNDYPYSIAIDDLGNSYVTGFFKSPTLNFGSIVLTNADSNYNTADVFLVKYDPDGNVIWAKRAGGKQFDQAYSVAVDIGGNVYLAGSFESQSISFGNETLNNFSEYNDDIFIVKYDSDGNVLWAKSSGGTSNDYAYAIAVDAFGNVYLTGNSYSTTINFGSSSSQSAGSFFLAKYTTFGNVIWAKSLGGHEYDFVNSIDVDPSGNAYIAGVFSDSSITFETITLTSSDTISASDLFLVKYNSNGEVLWARNAIGKSNEEATCVKVDNLGNAYLTGYTTSQSITFGSITLADSGSSNIFIAKYDATGNVKWAKRPVGNNDWAQSVAIDANGDAYLVGNFVHSITFGSTIITTIGSRDMYIAKLSCVDCINESNDSFTIQVFPNPSPDNIIVIVSKKATIEIFNSEGQLIRVFDKNKFMFAIDISDLSSGVYIIKASTEKGITTKKFIKQ